MGTGCPLRSVLHCWDPKSGCPAIDCRQRGSGRAGSPGALGSLAAVALGGSAPSGLPVAGSSGVAWQAGAGFLGGTWGPVRPAARRVFPLALPCGPPGLASCSFSRSHVSQLSRMTVRVIDGFGNISARGRERPPDTGISACDFGAPQPWACAASRGAGLPLRRRLAAARHSSPRAGERGGRCAVAFGVLSPTSWGWDELLQPRRVCGLCEKRPEPLAGSLLPVPVPVPVREQLAGERSPQTLAPFHTPAPRDAPSKWSAGGFCECPPTGLVMGEPGLGHRGRRFSESCQEP